MNSPLVYSKTLLLTPHPPLGQLVLRAKFNETKGLGPKTGSLNSGLILIAELYCKCTESH